MKKLFTLLIFLTFNIFGAESFDVNVHNEHQLSKNEGCFPHLNHVKTIVHNRRTQGMVWMRANPYIPTVQVSRYTSRYDCQYTNKEGAHKTITIEIFPTSEPGNVWCKINTKYTVTKNFLHWTINPGEYTSDVTCSDPWRLNAEMKSLIRQNGWFYDALVVEVDML